MNEWMDDWMIEWMIEWINEWLNEWVNEWMNDWSGNLFTVFHQWSMARIQNGSQFIPQFSSNSNMRLLMSQNYTSTKSWRGYIFTSVCLCVCVCVCVCLCVRLFSCEQNSSRTIAPIWMRFSLNSCLLHWLGQYWNWWSWSWGQCLAHLNLI